jgi:heme exporter protein A
MITVTAQSTHTTSLIDARSAGNEHAASAVRVDSLRKVIDDRIVLHDLEFAIAPGSLVALLGANGAGKSTLLKILAGLMPPTHGRIDLFGEPFSHNAAAMRSRIGYIGHNSMLYRELSAHENLVFFGRMHGLRNVKERASELLEQLGLAGREHDPLKTYSRGMLQRAAIARALLCDPELLLADEPFTGLDAPSARTLESILLALHQQGKTIILTNHDVAQSISLTGNGLHAGRVLVLNRGRLIVDARADSLDIETVHVEIARS